MTVFVALFLPIVFEKPAILRKNQDFEAILLVV
jgi:hypothetical protein